MAQDKNPNKISQNENQQQANKGNNKEDPKTFGKEPPMEEPQTPEHPDDYEVKADDSAENVKPTFH